MAQYFIYIYVYIHSDDIHLFYLTYLTSSSRVLFSIQVNLLPQKETLPLKCRQVLAENAKGSKEAQALEGRRSMSSWGRFPGGKAVCCLPFWVMFLGLVSY